VISAGQHRNAQGLCQSLAYEQILFKVSFYILTAKKSDFRVSKPAAIPSASQNTGEHLRVARGGSGSNVFAAIDLGTNNCRLLVARPTEDGFKVIDSFSRIVRLGEGLRANGDFTEDAMARTIDALRVCADKIRKQGVSYVRCVATAACRYADNRTEFVQRVKKATGLDIEIISAAEEARLAISGCISLFDDKSDYAFVFDIGGGSTELIWSTIDPPGTCDILEWTSLPLGVVSLAEEYDCEDVSPEQYSMMVAEVEKKLAPFETRHKLSSYIKNGQVQMIGTSGTVTTVAGIYLGLQRYDRNRVDGLWIDRDHINGISRRLATMTHDERIAEPCIGKERADLVVAGCAIWEAISNTWACDRIRVADRGLREGMLLDLIKAAKREDRRHA
jgi:exopolyphosphatase/guanosine-5'-triphosphate,3'-diphosphate pyrophosphatase